MSDPNTLSPTGVFDLGSMTDHERVRQLADAIVAGESEPCSPRDVNAPIDARIAAHLASSKQTVRALQWDGNVAVVFAMWGERRRLRPRSDDNSTGENALHVKLDQLSWLFQDAPIDWRVYPVDDGDPDDSAAVAIERAGLHPEGHRVSVLRLADAIPTDVGPLAQLEHVDDSRKGGAMIAGASRAVADDCDAVVLTDADNSVNLGQLGHLLGPFCGGASAVIGDRKHPDSVLVKAEARWGPGIVVLRHMQRMAGRALFATGLRDTQAAFKLYGRSALDDILAAPSTFGFAFDSDWIYSVLSAGTPIERTPFAFIDSIEDSASITQGPMTTWESLLRGLVEAAQARGVDHDTEMAQVILDHANAETLELVVKNVPPELDGVEDAQLGDPEVMTAQRLRTWLDDLTGSPG